MKAHHSGIRGRSERAKRHRLVHMAKGLCCKCCRPLSSRTLCEYHLKKQRDYRRRQYYDKSS